MLKLETPIEQIPRVQRKYRKGLARLGIKTLKDLLYHVPHRYEDFSNLKKISDLILGETATIRGKILDIKNVRTFKKRMTLTEAIVEDESGAIKAVWFNQPYLVRNMKKGEVVSLSGKVNFAYDSVFLSNPAYEVIRKNQESSHPRRASPGAGITNHELTHTGGLVSIYPETEGITSRYLRYLIKSLLPKIEIGDFLPPEIKKARELPELKKSIEDIHFPLKKEGADRARRRLAFEELFLLELLVVGEKLRIQKEKAPEIEINLPLIKKFIKNLPYKLTNAQRIAAWEILQDLNRSKPMNRLLEGDVGAGKTVVAAIAALNTASQNREIAFMAPTEILAEQHFKELTKLLEGFDVTIGLLTGGNSKIFDNRQETTPKRNQRFLTGPGTVRYPAGQADNRMIRLRRTNSAARRHITRLSAIGYQLSKKELLTKVETGKINILIGTHALIQEGVRFKNLALVIIDEQHRFGVEQRARIAQQSVISNQQSANIPHLLSMTATPIPRTLALTIYGDLDISLINEMPKGRREIITKVVAPGDREKAYQFIQGQIRKKQQAFIICPLIEESEMLEVAAATKEYERLSQDIFPDLRLGLLHGKIKSKEKERTMSDFKDRKIDILVSTSVVEVGIDIPNATVMLIEGADRFGLAQLYQFRGRVGRSVYQSYCFLFTDSISKKTHARLKAITTAKSGFELAEKDLQIRGPGDFYGTRQSGLPDLAMSSLGDLPLIKEVRKEAFEVLEKDPELSAYPLLREKMNEFRRTIHLE